MADINAYALGLELQLQADKAFQTLEKFKDQLAGVEKALTIAPGTFDTAGIAQATSQTVRYAKSASDVETVHKSVMEVLQQFQQVIGNINEGSGVMTKQTQKQIKELMRMKDAIAPMAKELKKVDLVKIFGPDKAKMVAVSVERFMKLDKILGDVTDKATEQTEKMTSMIDVLSLAGDEGKILADSFKQWVIEGSKAAVAFEFLRRGFADLIKMQDAYAPVTMRAIGTQRELIEASNDLRTSLGATADESVATFKSLAAAGFRANESIGEMARTNYMFSQATGVSTESTADFQRAIFTTNKDAKLTTVAVSELSAAIRNSGMSADEATKLIGGLTAAMRPLRFLWGEKQALDASKSITQFAAAIRTAGGDADAASKDMLALAQDPEKLITAFGVMGVKGKKNLEAFPQFFELSAEKLAAMQKQADSAGRALTSKVWAEAAHLSLNTADGMVKLWNAADQNVDKFKELLAAQTAGADVEEDFNSTMQTFTKSLKQLLQPLIALGSVILDVIVPALTIVLKPFIFLGKIIAGLINWLGKIPVVGDLIKGALGTALIVGITMKVMGFTDVIQKMIKAATGVPGALHGMWDALRSGTAAKGLADKATMALVRSQSIWKQVTKDGATVISGIEGKAITSAVNKLKELRGIKQGVTVAAKGMAGGLKGVGGAISSMLPMLGGAAEGFMGLEAGSLQAALGLAKAHPLIAAVVAVVGAALIVVPKLFEMFDSADKKTRALGAAFMVMMWPLVQVYTTLQLLWAVVKGVGEAIGDALSEAFEPLIDAWDSIFGKGEKAVKITEVFAKAMGVVTTAIKLFLKFFSPLIWIIKGVGVAMKGLIAIITSPIQAMKAVWNKVTSVFTSPLQTAKNAWKWAVGAISDSWTSAVKKMKEAWTGFTDLFKTTEKNAQKATVAVHQNMSARMQGAAEHLKALRAHRAVTNFGTALHQITRPEVTRAVDKAYSRADRIAEPLVKPITGRLTQPTDHTSTKTLAALSALSNATVKVAEKLDDKELGEIKELLKVYFPQFAEKNTRGGLGQTAANMWM